MKNKIFALCLMLPLPSLADVCSMVKFDVGADAVQMIREAAKANGSTQLRDTLSKADIQATHASLVRIQNPFSSLALFEVHVETTGHLETKSLDIGVIEMTYQNQVINLGQFLRCKD